MRSVTCLFQYQHSETGNSMPTIFSLSFKALVIGSLFITISGCGGGGTTPVSPNPVEPITPTPVNPDIYDGSYNYTASPYNNNDVSVSSNPTTPTVPIQNPFLPTISQIYKQQTVTNADDVWLLGHTGKDITIAVVDSGLNPNHKDFYDDSGNSRVNYNDARGVESADGFNIVFNNDYDDIDTPNYHGTHVASIAAGREFGIAPDATILPINVFFDDETAYSTVIHRAVDYALQNALIVNASIADLVNPSTLGGVSSEFNAYLTALKNNNSALIVAAGNGGSDDIGDPVGSDHFSLYDTQQNLAIQTAITNQVLNVIALNDSGSIANFSNYPGSCSDVSFNPNLACNDTVMNDIQNTFISVPGVAIEAAYGSSKNLPVTYDGTSMATPIVSGGLALLMSSWDQLSVQQAVSILKSTANQNGIYSDSSIYGVGLLDLEAAMTPVGDLQSAAMMPASFNTQQSKASIPNELSSLLSSPTLQSVAYFDDFSREFLLDMTPAISLTPSSLNWDSFLSSRLTAFETHLPLKNYRLSMQFDSKPQTPFKSLKLQNEQQVFEYLNHSSNQLISSQQIPLSQHFYINNLEDFSQSLLYSQVLSNQLSFTSSFQLHNEQFNPHLTEQKLETNQYSAGLNYRITPNLHIGFNSQIRQEKHQLMQLKGSGTFSFGEENTSQIHGLQLSYNHIDTQFFGEIKHGQLLNSQPSQGSYLKVNDAQIQQLTLGLTHLTKDDNSFGIKTYNHNPLLSTDMTLSVPQSVNQDGTINYQTAALSSRDNLELDSLELFYRSSQHKNLQYLFNIITTPSDSGFGLKLNSAF